MNGENLFKGKSVKIYCLDLYRVISDVPDMSGHAELRLSLRLLPNWFY